MDRVRMPQGRQFAVTWSIPDDYGGMTAAMLQRSSAFSRLGGTPVDVLTFDARPDTADLEQRLRERGVLDPGVRLVNLYDWLRRRPLPGGALKAERDVFTPLAEADATATRRRGDTVTSRVRSDDHGRTLQVDHYRDDGTLVLSDRRDTRRRGVIGGRSIVLCDPHGRPVRSWARIWPLYTAWLDALTDRRQSFMIVDSKTIARFMVGYRRSHVITAHVVHASHRSGAGDAHPVRASRRDVFEHLDGFDLVAVLTRGQAADIEQDVGATPNLVVIPNSRPAAGVSAGRVRNRGGSPHPGDPRDPDRGVVLATLTPRKRVSHAIDAVQRARGIGSEAGAGGAAAGLRLDVYGDGESHAALERRIRDDPAVRLHGFDPDARREFATASFLLLTSRSEGSPLVLVEAMAAGCLPIAYDIRYGPSDLIRNGRNGYLVPAGDVDALAAAMGRLRELPSRRVEAMRCAAMRSARRFDEARVTQIWARELHRSAVRRRLRRSPKLRHVRELTARSRVAASVRTVVVNVVTAFGSGRGSRGREKTGTSRG
ncbi:glycosyltransferase [Agromyces sp. SYSU K20354]|uniref:glycosyltransferase n=1 Tax=Agromyces cavernae TaxID=2898659 RepID=UPI001E3C844C|nr:glycosyltransferase [Agromyces cavernae]MCD2443363.1 glycosyltransferase [Agromyces cavernae]